MSGKSDSKRLSQTQFYQAAEYLKKNKEKFTTARPTHAAAALMLEAEPKFPVSATAVPSLQKATGVVWTAKLSRADGTHKVNSTNRIRTCVIAIRRLYHKLNEEVPAALEGLYEEFRGNAPEEVPPAE